MDWLTIALIILIAVILIVGGLIYRPRSDPTAMNGLAGGCLVMCGFGIATVMWLMVLLTAV